MDAVILAMLAKYQCQTEDEFENALKQIMQQIALLGLWRSKFYEHAAFYGGTALRILYGLNRFSEDLDFSLLYADPLFSLTPYLSAIQEELTAFGFSVEITLKKKNIDTAIHSAFLKSNTQQHLISVNAPPAIKEAIHARKVMTIKLEVDTNPPLGFTTQTRPLLNPIPFWVKSYSLSDQFSGKLSACLCRQWKNKVKGRDWYDFLWFLQQGVKFNRAFLETRLREFGFYVDESPLSMAFLKKLLISKIESLNIEWAKEDINKFIKDPSEIDAWSKSLFLAAVDMLAAND